MRAAQTIPANIAMAWLGEGFAIARAGTYEAHCQHVLPALAIESCRTPAGEHQYLAEHGFVQWVLSKVRQKPIAHTQPLYRNSSGPCRLRSQR